LAVASVSAAATTTLDEELLDALSAALAWPTWDALRLWSHRSYEEAQQVLLRMARAVLRSEGHPA
jgi:hypothetical protein